ncbi:MAG: AMP-binding protein [Cardiobacteriaceae bacterium]|nr:AMP-binding protein [Cardiobacteriaceae bacterium]
MSHQDSDMPWLKSYPDDVPALLPELRHANLGSLIESFSEKFADQPAFSQYSTTFSFEEIYEDAQAFGAYLQRKLNYEKGERLALMMPNVLPYPIVLYGCFMTGIVAVNINPLYTPNEIRIQLTDSSVRGIVISEAFIARFLSVRRYLPQLRDIIIVQNGDGHGFFEKKAINMAARKYSKQFPKIQVDNAIFYKEIISKGARLALKTSTCLDKDVALLQYTGGTTGSCKAAVITHRNLMTNVAQITQWCAKTIEEPDMLSILALPLYHIFSLTVNLLCIPSLGIHSRLILDPRDTKKFIKTMKKNPFSIICGVNTLFKNLLEQDEFRKLNFSRLRFTIAGGMRLDEEVSNHWFEVTGNRIVEGYGLTEASPIVCVNLLDTDSYTGGVGYPLPDTKIKICNENGIKLPADTAGELWVKGPQVMQGYWKYSDETRRVLTPDNWLKTGDIATLSKDGFVKIVSRKKDLIIVSGFNVYPSEIETVLKKHPDVLEAAVVGEKDTEHGEKITAFIQKRQNSKLNEEQLRSLIRKFLTNYKRPSKYIFIDEMPKSPVGKILKHKLLENL